MLEHRQLIVADRDTIGAERGDIGGLTYRIEQKPGRQRVGKAFLGNFGFYRGVARHARHADDIHIQHRQLRQRGQRRLQAQRRSLGIDADRQVIRHHLQNVVCHLLRAAAVIGQPLQIGDHHIQREALLQRKALAQEPT